MQVRSFRGDEIMYDLEESNNIGEYNSVRAFVHGNEVDLKDIEINFYIEKEEKEDQKEEETGKVKRYDIWVEGFAATGNSAEASYVGSAIGTSLNDAVKTFYHDKPDKQKWLDKEHRTYWGCRFFDNEADARKAFG